MPIFVTLYIGIRIYGMKERIVICGNPECEAELRRAKPDEVNGRLSQQHCRYCGYTAIPKIVE